MHHHSRVLFVIGLALAAGGLLGLVGLADLALAAPGSEDPAFGNGGRVATSFGPEAQDQVLALVIQPDGKLVAAGQSGDGGTADRALARYLRR